MIVMQPDNVGYTDQSDPFGFITNNPQKPKRSFGPSGMAGRIAVIAAILVVLIIMAIVVSALLSRGDKAQTQRLIEISQRQTEIIRITTQADKNAKSLSTRSYALTTRVSLESSQKNVNQLLAKRGVKEKALSKQLTAGKNTKTDAALSEAQKNNRFDETFTEIMGAELTNYQKLLNGAADGAKKSEKDVLQKSFNSAATIQAKPQAAPKPATPAQPSEETTDEFSDETLLDEEL